MVLIYDTNTKVTNVQFNHDELDSGVGSARNTTSTRCVFACVQHCLFTDCFGTLHLHGIDVLNERAAGKQCTSHLTVRANGNKDGCCLSEIVLDSKI